MKKVHGIYKITNKINGKSYIGQSVNIDKRIKAHLWAYNKEHLPTYNYHLYQAFRKYGIDNFEISILETIDTIDKNLLNELEIKYIQLYDSYHSGYNMTIGGDGMDHIKHSGEYNSHVKLTQQDIIDIRTRYNNRELKRNVYKDYETRINKTGFHKIWNWATWPDILPEYHNEENIKWHSTYGKALSSTQAAINASHIDIEEVIMIRQLYQEGLTYQEIKQVLELYNIEIEEIRRISLNKRWNSIK